MPNIALINRTPRIRDAPFARLLPALQAQVNEDVAPHWMTEMTILHLVGRKEQPDPTHWKIWLLGTSDIAGDLGCHEDDTGIPEAKIFTEDDMRYGAEISVTISHELIEMLVNPRIDQLVNIGGVQYVREACDAVEADGDGYLKLDHRMSNFVLPSYFQPGSAGPWDFRSLLSGSCPAKRPGGYVLSFHDGAWHTDARRYADGTMSHRASKPFGRTARVAARSTSP